jgi:hypothetical protein
MTKLYEYGAVTCEDYYFNESLLFSFKKKSNTIKQILIQPI